MKDPIRVLLLEMPHLLRDIFEHAIERREDCALLKDVGRATDAFNGRTAQPDVVILGLRTADDSTLVPGLHARWPHSQIMTVMEAGDGVAVYEARPRPCALHHMPPDGIVQWLCDEVYRSRGLAS